VTSGYLDPTPDLFSADGWLRSGDIARMSNQGVTIVGRLKNVIIVHGVNYYCREIEVACERDPDVKGAIACGYRMQGDATDRVAIFLEARPNIDSASCSKRIRRALTVGLGINPGKIIITDLNSLPRTAGGKIRRVELAEMLASERL
jgi:acyl-CoA synthetase (AMP-forming)/AMP-acid ligase II